MRNSIRNTVAALSVAAAVVTVPASAAMDVTEGLTAVADGLVAVAAIGGAFLGLVIIKKVWALVRR